MKRLLLSATAILVLAAPATAGNYSDDLKGFNQLFRDTIAQGHKNGAKIEQFSNDGEVGWQQVVNMDGTNVVQITTFLSPPSTFAIKHLCFGNLNHVTEMTCESNLGEIWIETKRGPNDWVKSNLKELSWARDLSKFAFD